MAWPLHRASAKSARRARRRFSFVDGTLASIGLATAAISASFAMYMVTTDHPKPTFGGIEHLMVFAEPSRSVPHAAVAQTALPEAGIDDTSTGSIDYTTTGAIPPESSARETLPAVMDLRQPILASYFLHDVRDGEAIVVGRDDGVYRVEIGSVLPEVGRVLAIEQRDGRWVVVTTQGLIVARSF